MKTLKTFIICLFIISVQTVFAADEKFVAAMEKGIEILNTNTSRSADQYQLAANHFERIASAEAKEWLPLYYAAYSNLNAGLFTNGNAKKDELYDKASSQLKAAEIISKDNSEIYALQGYVVLMKLAVDPMVRSMSMMPEGMGLLEKAKKLNPENPRSYLIQGQFTFYMPEAFGGGKAKAKPLLLTGQEKYASQKPASSIDPSWGKQRLEDLLKMGGE